MRLFAVISAMYMLFIHVITAYAGQGVESIPVHMAGGGALDRMPVHHRTHIGTQSKYRKSEECPLAQVHILRLWQESSVPLKETQIWYWNLQPWRCVTHSVTSIYTGIIN